MEALFERLTTTDAACVGADALNAAPRLGLLAGGGVHSVVTAAGSGFAAFGDRLLTRWRGDRVTDADGVFFYLRDLDSGAVWSAGYQPTRRVPDRYEARFSPGVVEIEREDVAIETRMAACVAPEAPAALWCLTLTNHSDRPRRIEVTSYAELVLHDRWADAAHPAFSKLFVETEKAEGEPVLLARRRPRGHDDVPVWGAHFTDEADAWETDRLRFLGRGRDRSNPRALDTDVTLSGTTGAVLDPVASFRRVVELEPGVSAEAVFGLVGGATRDEVAALAERFSDPAAVRHAFVEAKARAAASLDTLDVSEEEADRFDRWAAGLLYGDPSLRAPHADPHAAQASVGTLGSLGVSATDPLVVARVETVEALGVLPTLLKAKAYWASRGLHAPLVVLAGDEVREGVESITADIDGIHIAALGTLDEATVALVETAARLWTGGTLPDAEGGASEPLPERFVPTPPDFEPFPDEDLQFFNGYGGFSVDGSEYVLRIEPDGGGRLTLPPLPWVNVIANEEVGFIATERGALHTWAANSRENRLTPWTNDPVSDPFGEALYVRDDDSGAFWSPTPGPVARRAAHEVRHGWGCTTFRHTADGIEHDVTHFVPRHDPVRLTRVRLTNHGDTARRLSLVSYARLVLGGEAETTGRFVVTDAVGDTLLARNATAGEFAGLVAFAGVSAPDGADVRFTTDRAAFLGRNGSTGAPRALRSDDPLDGTTGDVLDPCFVFAVPVAIAPGETVELGLMLGQAEGEASALALADRYRAPGAVHAALDAVRAFWQRTVSAVQIETPRPELDLMVNGWLAYQNLSCRMWGRTAYYQSGGAFGFRDQLQDASALVYARPDLTREQIVLHAAHQFEQGDVLHWWHPPTSKGIRTRFSDDLLWLPYVTAFYVETTGDASVLDESARFLTARELEPGEDEVFLTPEDAGTEASVYEHGCRALDRSLTNGAHGLPLMGTGDWNDGMNSVGDEGEGESVWLGFFLADILRHFIPICAERGDDRAERYRTHLADLEAALNDTGWDGAWYRRAYYDDGAPMGSAGNDECRIDAIAQGWSVISGVAPPERIEQALDAAEDHLIRDGDGLIRLLTPPFDNTDHDPGYIKGYVPGVRENGGQYTHGVLWLVRAFAEAGRVNRAADLLAMLSPVRHTRDTAAADRYKTEPYVVAADVYSVAPHVGRGGWTWYTGSAGWTFRVAVESILGFGIEDGDTLTLAPRIPDDWPGFSLRYRRPDEGGTVEIEVTRGSEAAATFDGEPVVVRDGAVRVPLPDDGATHRLALMLPT